MALFLCYLQLTKLFYYDTNDIQRSCNFITKNREKVKHYLQSNQHHRILSFNSIIMDYTNRYMDWTPYYQRNIGLYMDRNIYCYT